MNLEDVKGQNSREAKGRLMFFKNGRLFIFESNSPKQSGHYLQTAKSHLPHNTIAANNPASPANPTPAFIATAPPTDAAVVVAAAADGIAEYNVALGVTTTVLCRVAGTVRLAVGRTMLELPKLVAAAVGPV